MQYQEHGGMYSALAHPIETRGFSSSRAGYRVNVRDKIRRFLHGKVVQINLEPGPLRNFAN